MSINPLDVVSAYNRVANNKAVGGTGAPGQAQDAGEFAKLIRSGVDAAIDSQYKSEKVSADAVIGKASMVDVVQAVNDAEVSLNTVIAVRDRVISAYEKILQMPI